MKNSKALIAIIITIVMCAALMAACGNNASAPPASGGGAASPPPASGGGDSPPPASSGGGDGPSRNIRDYWSPEDGRPDSYNESSPVYTMDNRVPWQGMFIPPEPSRAAQDKAIQPDNRKDNLRVGYNTWSVGTPFFVAQMNTVEEAANRNGWDFTYLVSGGDVTVQIANLETLISMDVDIIINHARNSEAEAMTIATAVAEGIPVIGLGSPYPLGTPVITTAGSMQYEKGFSVGMQVADHFSDVDFLTTALSPGTMGHTVSDSKLNGFLGGISYGRAITLGIPFDSREDAMMHGFGLFEQVVSSARFVDDLLQWEAVNSVPGSWSREGGQAAAEDILTAHPDIQFLFTDNDQQAMGAILAMRQGGFTPGVDILIACVGDGEKAAIEHVRDGEILAMALQSPYTWASGPTNLIRMIFEEGFDATNLPSVVFFDIVVVNGGNAAQWISDAEYSTLPDIQFIPLG